MDHLAHQSLAPNDLTEAVIYGPHDEKVGTVSHVHGAGTGSQVIIDVGGFLGVGAKPVALAVSELNFMRDENGSVHAPTSLTKHDAKALPEHDH